MDPGAAGQVDLQPSLNRTRQTETSISLIGEGMKITPTYCRYTMRKGVFLGCFIADSRNSTTGLFGIISKHFLFTNSPGK